MESRTEVVLAASVGVVGFALSVVGGLLAGEFDPAVGDTPSNIVSFYQGATFDAQFVTGVILETLGFLLLMAFVVKLAYLVQSRRDRTSWPGTVIVVSVTVATVLTLVSILSLAAGTFRASNGGLTGDGYVVLTDIRQAAYWVSLPAWALVFLACGTLIVRNRSFPTWLGWAALIIGTTLLVVPFIDSVDIWDAATGLGGLWFLATALYALARPDRYSLPATEGA
jgi:hypothetical protein